MPESHPHQEGEIPVNHESSRKTVLTANRLHLFFLILLAVSTTLRILVSIFPKSAVIYNDELFSLELAQNIWLRGSISVYAAQVHYTKLLYPLLISPFYAVTDGLLRSRLISGFNALLISSSLIPGYLLARKLLHNNLHIALSLIILALSPNLLFSVTFMSENLFCPLLLWAFLAVYCLIEKENFTPLRAILLGLLGFLLFFVRESGAAFFIALAALLLFVHSFAAFGYSLAGFLVPALLLRFTVFHGFGFANSWASAISSLSNASHLMYLFYATGIILLFFLLSAFWFPVALPILRRKQLSKPSRYFLFLCLIYTLILAVGVAWGISLKENFRSLTLRIHLRYFMIAAWFFLLLFLALPEEQHQMTSKRPLKLTRNSLRDFKTSLSKDHLFIFTALFAVAILLFLFLPDQHSFVDYPLLDIVNWIPESQKWLWAVKLSLLALLALGLLLRNRQKVRILSSIIILPLLAMELLSGISFYRSAKREESIADPSLLSEVRLLDETLDSLDGTTLVVAKKADQPQLRLLNTLSDNVYALLLTNTFSKQLSSFETETKGILPMDNFRIPTPFPRYTIDEYYNLQTVDYILTVGDWNPVLHSANIEITPAGVSSFHLYQAAEPSTLTVLNTNTQSKRLSFPAIIQVQK